VSSAEERAFLALTDKISRARGLCCGSYKDKCLKRRIAVRMRARGVHTYDEYARLLDQDTREYQELLDALTINVTKFFRNAEAWQALRPYLEARARARGRPPLRVWSAGCASGEEPYTIAILLADARIAGTIDATDIDRVSLERARAAAYPAAAFSEMPAALKRRYIRDGQPAPEIRERVRVLAHDLTRQPPPAPPQSPYDVIVCRNVVIYFERAAQEQLFATFARALAPGGILMLGKVETLFGPARDELRLADARERIYVKPA
jgi:chemotaxis methyl-accepting protein methylase